MTNGREIIIREKQMIVCPECGSLQQAEVVWYRGDPWPCYVHTCTACKYVIMESEWEEVITVLNSLDANAVLGCCDSCQWWLEQKNTYNDVINSWHPGTYKRIETEEEQINVYGYRVRYCKNPKIVFYQRPDEDGATVMDGSEYKAELLTAEKFGCKLHVSTNKTTNKTITTTNGGCMEQEETNTVLPTGAGMIASHVEPIPEKTPIPGAGEVTLVDGVHGKQEIDPVTDACGMAAPADDPSLNKKAEDAQKNRQAASAVADKIFELLEQCYVAIAKSIYPGNELTIGDGQEILDTIESVIGKTDTIRMWRG